MHIYQQRNFKFILWQHIKDLYEKVKEMAVASNGLTLLPKLTYEHIYLTSYSKMRVDLAAQVKCAHVYVCTKLLYTCMSVTGP